MIDVSKRLLTPLGEIQIYIDDICSDYEYEEYSKDIRSLREQPVAGSYRIVISRNDWKTVRCVVSLYDTEIPNTGDSGEQYLCSEFVKDNIILTIGAGDDNPAFDTNRTRYGMEYVRKAKIDKVVFGIAWATDYESPFDIRTQLATDLYETNYDLSNCLLCLR